MVADPSHFGPNLTAATAGIVREIYYARLSATQFSNVAAGNHAEFDEVFCIPPGASRVTLSTGSGQANGIFTMQPGLWLGWVSLQATLNTGNGLIQLVEHPSDTPLVDVNGGNVSAMRCVSPQTNTGNVAAPSLPALFNLTTETDVKVEITTISSGTWNNISLNSRLLIAYFGPPI